MTENFKDILYMPVDLPKFEFSKELIQEFNPKPPSKNVTAFEYEKLTEDQGRYAKTNWKDPDSKIANYCNSNLPIADLVNVKIHHYVKPGTIHLDFVSPDLEPHLYAHSQEMEPCGYRMVMATNKIIPNPVIELPTGEHVFGELPEDTDWYIINFTETLHGGLKIDPDRYILYCQFWVNKTKHFEILERSLEKYREWVIWK